MRSGRERVPFSSQGGVSGRFLGTSSGEACRKSDSAFPTNWSERLDKVDV